MPSAGEIKLRIASIQQTKKVTDAMYMIASVKMRRAKREVLDTKPYFTALREEIKDLFRYIPETDDRYFRVKIPEGQPYRRRGLLLVTSDKGLAGGYNQSLLKEAERFHAAHPDARFFIIGECGRRYFAAKKLPYVGEFHYSAAFPTIREAREICTELLTYYNAEEMDEISMIFTDYHATRPSECKLRCLLPLDRSRFSTEPRNAEPGVREFYPDATSVLRGVIPSYLTGYIYSCLVDSYCSEQEARMTAMHSAGDNADEILKQLRMQYNSLRQAAITREMIEITSGAKALRQKRRQQQEVEL